MIYYAILYVNIIHNLIYIYIYIYTHTHIVFSRLRARRVQKEQSKTKETSVPGRPSHEDEAAREG